MTRTRKPAARKKKAPAKVAAKPRRAAVHVAAAPADARACIKEYFPGSGSDSPASKRISRSTWRDKANEIADCILGIPRHANAPRDELVSLIEGNYNNPRNKLVVDLNNKLK